MKNKLIVIGWMGDKTAYLNISKEEAINRWFAEHGEHSESYKDVLPRAVKEIEFDTEFCVYDA